MIGLSSSVVSSVIDDNRFSFNFVANLIAYYKWSNAEKKTKQMKLLIIPEKYI